jgi:tRNA pseudouridine38-40 synthase
LSFMQSWKPGSQTGQPITGVRNIRLLLAFDGSAYHGWQIQSDQSTVQGTLAAAIEKITGERIMPTGSGRTDAGTHARRLVANFFTTSRMTPGQIVRALNSSLPRDIRVLSARRVSPEFHARRCASSKIYRYQFYRGQVMPPHLAREYYHYPFPLDLKEMKTAARLFVGEHDFVNFAAKQGRRDSVRGEVEVPRSTIRRIYRSELRHSGYRSFFTVEGNGFLQHMVRNMVGALLEVGRGRISKPEFASLLEKGELKRARFTPPAHGLVLLKVRY